MYLCKISYLFICYHSFVVLINLFCNVPISVFMVCTVLNKAKLVQKEAVLV